MLLRSIAIRDDNTKRPGSSQRPDRRLSVLFGGCRSKNSRNSKRLAMDKVDVDPTGLAQSSEHRRGLFAQGVFKGKDSNGRFSKPDSDKHTFIFATASFEHVTHSQTRYPTASTDTITPDEVGTICTHRTQKRPWIQTPGGSPVSFPLFLVLSFSLSPAFSHRHLFTQ